MTKNIEYSVFLFWECGGVSLYVFCNISLCIKVVCLDFSVIISVHFFCLVAGMYSPGPPLPRPILPRERGTVDRVIEYLVGDGPEKR